MKDSPFIKTKIQGKKKIKAKKNKIIKTKVNFKQHIQSTIGQSPNYINNLKDQPKAN